MKTIEERANKLIDFVLKDVDPMDCLLFAKLIKEGYITGATEEHEILTSWHDPKEELPKPFDPDDDYPLLIKDSKGKVWTGFYRAYNNSWWLAGITGNFNVDVELIHWREIHDGLPLETYKEMEEDESSNTQPATIILDALPHLEWMAENLTGHGGTEVDGRWYYTWNQAMRAAKELGNGWRLPTRDEFKALADAGSTWEDERKGMLFGGKLFFPASGYRHATSGALGGVGTTGYSWSASPHSETSDYAGNLSFSSSNVYPLYYSNRSYGFPVRCAREIER